MPRELASLGEFAKLLMEQTVIVATELEAGCKDIGKAIQKTAQAEFGVYQPRVGPFPKWPELAQSTKDDRYRLGFSENEPLLRTGSLMNSITFSASMLEVVVGSADERMPYHEFGTATIPPRPVLGPAAIHNKARIQAIAGGAVVSALFGGGKAVHPSLGYNFTV